jgi:hypothetical protein
MNHFKYLLIMSLLPLISNISLAQTEKKRIYFLVDTLNIPKNDRFVEIDDNYFEVSYIFYCRCSAPTYKDLIFSFTSVKDERITEMKKPMYDYISWKDLLKITSNTFLFKKNYELYITEILPNKRYRTNKVNLVGYSITD